MEDKLLNEKDLAQELGISTWSVRYWRFKKGLPCIKAGRRIFYRMSTVLQWLENNEKAEA